jgi:uncharacterized membrane protein
MTIREKFEIPKRYSLWSYALIAVGIISVILLYVTHGASNSEHERARFWGSLLQNSVFFLLVVNAAMFFLCATILPGVAGQQVSEEYQKQLLQRACYRCYLRSNFISDRFW